MKRMSGWSRIVFAVSATIVGLWGFACGEAMMGGGFGATQGGVQDMGFARELIAEGRVPPPEAFIVEGMFSEHDLPLGGEVCRETLCLRTAMGIAPTLDGAQAGWMQIGLSSTIDPATWQRPSLTLVAAVDVSGSMGWRYGDEEAEYPSPGTLARSMLREIAGELDARDQLAIVTYGSSVKTELELTSGDEQGRITRAIDDLSEGGSTNMQAGLERAFELARGALGQRDETRVVLFTDVQPNVGLTESSDFEAMARTNGDAGVGLTVFGVGLGLGQEVLNGMSHLRGGNAFSLMKSEHVDEIMADSWPFMFSPIAYGLNLSAAPSEGYVVGGAYGIPAEADGAVAESTVATVFLSRRRGAILVRFDPEGDDLSGLQVSGSLSYQGLDGQTRQQQLTDGFDGTEVLDARGQFHAQPSVDRTVALAVLVQAMKDAATAYQTAETRPEAVATMTDAVARFEADAAAIGDEDLQPEVELARALLALMDAGAEQGDLYGR